jgi:hypothetical protein
MARFEDLKAGIERRLGSEPFRRNDASFIEKFFRRYLSAASTKVILFGMAAELDIDAWLAQRSPKTPDILEN